MMPIIDLFESFVLTFCAFKWQVTSGKNTRKVPRSSSPEGTQMSVPQPEGCWLGGLPLLYSCP